MGARYNLGVSSVNWAYSNCLNYLKRTVLLGSQADITNEVMFNERIVREEGAGSMETSKAESSSLGVATEGGLCLRKQTMGV